MNMFTVAIEKNRTHMIKLAYQNGYTAKETVRASQHLDKLLNLVGHSPTWKHLNEAHERHEKTDSYHII
ncbi:hypothetical protein NG54_02245 [Heyndrickxia ginsengihumi]|uniref:Aspartyl-phosphate phosphatase Spo0E family protein n=2 Tax=Heyndrickxia ginsengihumi TaxID=363870 RepID=A0A0A6VJ62_9BACI|nr:hypothetical protein NG54_02245 [Heyndrickxia ginsengihumi]